MPQPNIIIKITMKQKTTRTQFLQFTSWLDSHGKLLSNAEQTNADCFVAIACFDDRIDYLAFLVSTGLCPLSCHTIRGSE